MPSLRRFDPATAFVALVFAVALATSTWLVAAHGTSLGLYEDLSEVNGQVHGGFPSWSWFWAPHNEHRVPLPRVLHWACLRATRDFRTATYVDLALLAAAALALVVAARRTRGRTHAVDAGFPLALLSPAGVENLLNGLQICFVLPVVVIAFVMASMPAAGGALRARTVWVVAIALAALALCGPIGIVQVPLLAAWLAWVGWRARSRPAQPDDRRRTRLLAWIAIAGAAAGCVAAAVALVGFEHSAGFEPASIRRTLVVSLQFLACSLGPAARSTWPWSGLLAGAALVAVAAWLAISARVEPRSRERSLGWLAVACGIGLVALAVAYGRARFYGLVGMQSRYATVAALLPCLLLLASAAPSAFQRAIRPRLVLLAQVVLLGALAWGFVASLQPALAYAHGRTERTETTRAAVDEGLAYGAISRPGVPDVFYGAEYAAKALWLLDRAGLPPFERARGPDPLLLLGRDPADVRFHGPAVVRGSEPSERSAEGRFVLAAHAGTELEWPVPRGARTLRGCFAVPEALWSRGGGEGLRFEVEIRSAEGASLARQERVLFPVSKAEDRGFHDFGLRLPAVGPAAIILRVSSVDPAPRGPAWGFWADVRAR